MSKEGVPLQANFFNDNWEDNRSAKQRRQDRERDSLKQMEMFSQREVALFGVRANPVMDLHPGRLELICEDPRTPEEREADLMREAQRLTYQMFSHEEDESIPVSEPSINLPTVSQPPIIPIVGYRRRQRQLMVNLKRR